MECDGESSNIVRFPLCDWIVALTLITTDLFTLGGA